MYVFLALGLSLTTSTVVASAPDYAGFSAVPQIWIFPERFIIAPDRIWLASISNNGNIIQIVDNTSGTILRTLSTGFEKVYGPSDPPPTNISITDDSATVVARLDDGSTRAWDVGTGKMLAMAPAARASKERTLHAENPSAYKIAIIKNNGVDETISISSGSSVSGLIRFSVPAPFSCGSGGAANVTFDGEELVFSLIGGESAVDADMPAIAFRLVNGTFHELWRSQCEEERFVIGVVPTVEPLLWVAGDIGVDAMKVWNLITNRLVASFPLTDGSVAASSDGETIVTGACLGVRDRTFSVLHHGKRTSFGCPLADTDHLFVSPNGKWLAATTNKATDVWSLPAGRPTTERKGEGIGVTNAGTVLYHKKLVDKYHGHTIKDRSDDGRWLVDDDGLVFDTWSGKIVAERPGVQHLSNDGRATTRSTDGTLRSFDLKTDRLLWSVQATKNIRGYVMTYPDGCVQVSGGAERYVRLVHGYSSRPFDDAARLAFSKPACRGMPAAMAESEAALHADRAHVASFARADTDEQTRQRKEADAATMAKARREEAARRAWDAGAPEREVTARRAAAMISDAVVVRDAAQTVRFAGKVAWHLSKSADDADAVGVVTVPGLDFDALLAIDEDKAPAPDGTGVVGIMYHPRPSPNSDKRPGVAAIGQSASGSSMLPMHIGLHWNGPGRIPGLPRFDPPDGVLRLASLLPPTWIDIPLVLDDGGRATLSIAIGAAGREVIDEVVAFKKTHP